MPFFKGEEGIPSSPFFCKENKLLPRKNRKTEKRQLLPPPRTYNRYFLFHNNLSSSQFTSLFNIISPLEAP